MATQTVETELDRLRRDLERYPGASVHITDAYLDNDGRWRVTVSIASVVVFVPRFASPDDALSFRFRALRLVSDAR